MHTALVSTAFGMENEARAQPHVIVEDSMFNTHGKEPKDQC